MSRRSINPHAFELREGGDGGVLLGGYSRSSDRFHFPCQDVCPYTGAADVERVELSGAATLWGWTAVTAAPPGYAGPVPYGFGVVEIGPGTGAGLRVVTQIAASEPERLTFGMPVTLRDAVIARDEDGTDVVTWTFEPELPR